MIEWYKKVVFENYANFKGRASRSEYWYFVLANMIISIPLNYILPLVIAPELALIGTIYSLGVFLPSIAVGIRRMHDVGKSGWYILIPLYNFILLCTDSEEGTNEYGPNPDNLFEEIEEIGTSEA
ncbi:DUF805 domain-containing protein [Flavobacterium eburneipallidum]|uniref:DUF805 domain-containing protein n=1 Tax=Flavobacterium eburneipallidum TaxID=3003263 RepID=UPI0022AC39BE|nr:DUF805 domain-containing protein [Flavobacterium eburneipallidum]